MFEPEDVCPRVQIPWKPPGRSREQVDCFIEYGPGQIYAPLLNARSSLSVSWREPNVLLAYSPYRDGFGRERARPKPATYFLLLYRKHSACKYSYLKVIETSPVHKYQISFDILESLRDTSYRSFLRVHQALLSENITSYICSKEDYCGYF